jgi:IMP dehydrogenase
MDTVTEAEMAIAVARAGGIGVIHKNLNPRAQASRGRAGQAQRVGHDHQPDHPRPRTTIQEALALMAHYKISGVPITDGSKLVGILTNRDLRFVSDTPSRCAR